MTDNTDSHSARMDGNGMREPCALIHQTAGLIQPDADLETHYRIQDHLRVADDARDKVREDTRSKLRGEFSPGRDFCVLHSH